MDVAIFRSTVFWLITLIILNIADFGTTHFIVSHRGYGAEFNPFLRSLMEHFNTPHIILAVKIIVIIILCFVEKFQLVPPNKLQNVVKMLCVALALVVAWNIHICHQILIS